MLQDMAFCMAKDGLLHGEMALFAWYFVQSQAEEGGFSMDVSACNGIKNEAEMRLFTIFFIHLQRFHIIHHALN